MKKIGIIFTLIIFVVALPGCGGNTKCIAEGCNEEAYKDGLCKDHYIKLNKTNDAETTTNVTKDRATIVTQTMEVIFGQVFLN